MDNTKQYSTKQYYSPCNETLAGANLRCVQQASYDLYLPRTPHRIQAGEGNNTAKDRAHNIQYNAEQQDAL